VSTVALVIIFATINVGVGYVLALYIHAHAPGPRTTPNGVERGAVDNVARNSQSTDGPTAASRETGPAEDLENIQWSDGGQHAATEQDDAPSADTEAAQPSSDFPLADTLTVDEGDAAADSEERPDDEATEEMDEPPPPWLSILEAAVEPGPFCEALLQSVRYELGRFREQLIEQDEDLRQIDPSQATSDRDQTIIEVREQVHVATRRFLKYQKQMLEQLSVHQADLGELASIGESIQAALEEASQAIESSDDPGEFANDEEGGDPAIARLRTKLTALFDAGHRLRDATGVSLSELILKDSSRESESGLLIDGSTLLRNRAGLELVLRDWWKEDPNHVRPLSIVALGVDKFGEINARVGVLAGDRLLEGLADLIRGLLRQNRGYDVATRLDGRRLILVLGDTPPHGAACAAERIRQTLQAAKIESQGESIPVSVSCGVTDARPEDTSRTLIDRALRTMREGTDRGGNLTVIDEGDGPREYEPPDYAVEATSISLSG